MPVPLSVAVGLVLPDAVPVCEEEAVCEGDALVLWDDVVVPLAL